MDLLRLPVCGLTARTGNHGEPEDAHVLPRGPAVDEQAAVAEPERRRAERRLALRGGGDAGLQPADGRGVDRFVAEVVLMRTDRRRDCDTTRPRQTGAG